MSDLPFETQLRQQAEHAVRTADKVALERLQAEGLRWSKMLREVPPVRAAAQSVDPEALPRLVHEGLIWAEYAPRVHAVEPYGEALRHLGVHAAVLARFQGWQRAGITVTPVDPADRQVALRNPLHALNAHLPTADPAVFAALWDLLVDVGADPQGRAQPVDAFTDAYALARRPTAAAVRAAHNAAPPTKTPEGRRFRARP